MSECGIGFVWQFRILRAEPPVALGWPIKQGYAPVVGGWGRVVTQVVVAARVNICGSNVNGDHSLTVVAQ